MNDNLEISLYLARQEWQAADALLICAGRGVSADMHIRQWNDSEVFWRDFPGLRKNKLLYTDVATPLMFASEPRLAWGFFAHRYNQYRQAEPRPLFAQLSAKADQMVGGYRVLTDIIDGQFQASGFDEMLVCEVLGSIHYLQCSESCQRIVWKMNFQPTVDTRSCHLMNDLPRCPFCHQLARPNVLLFDDWQWIQERIVKRYLRVQEWLAWQKNQTLFPFRRLLCLELGTGQTSSTVRELSEQSGAFIIRIDENAPAVPDSCEGITLHLTPEEGIARLLAD